MISESDLTQPSADETRRGRLLDLGRLPAKLIQQSSRDPADSVSGAPANFGQSIIPHIYTVQAQYGAQGRAYLQSDEALKHNRHNANIMRTETQIMECLEARQRGVALLNWHIEPEDDKSHDQRELVKELTRIVERTPDFLEYRRNLLEALWYGRYACANSFRAVQVGNNWRQVVGRWEPRHGDKLVFRYETDTKEYNPDQVGIRIHAGFYRDPLNHQKVEQTHFGLVRWFDEWERKLFSLHKHIIEDGPFEEPYDAGRIHGVGIRDRIYWTWYAMKELEANLLIYMERTALGVEIWRYPKGNPQAEEATRIAATERVANGRTIVLVPIEPGANADLYGVERIEPGGAGAEVMLELIRDFYGHRIKRYILGQVLSSEAASTGLGSGVADAHMATYADIIQYDATKLEESLTRDFLHIIRDRNFKSARGINVRFKIDTASENVQEKLESLKLAWDMGLEMKTDDVFDSIGLSRPDENDETVKNPQFDKAAMGGMGGGMPGQGGGTSTFGPMPGNPLGGTPKDADSDGVAGEGTGQAKQAANNLDRYGRRYDPATVHELASQAKAEPSDPQREAGNYVKGHVSIHGLRLSIENPKGTRRRPEGPVLPAHYGYIRGYEGRDKDHIDVFLGPDPNAEIVFIVDQVTEGGRFDEHKVMLGFHTQKEAVDAYRKSYPSGWRVGPVTPLTIDQFKRWLDKGDLTKRVEGQVSKYGANRIPGEVDRYRDLQREFEESKHPRDADGKFAPKGTFDKPSAERKSLAPAKKVGEGKESKIVLEDGTEAPPHIQAVAGKIPPAWSNVQVSTDPNSDVLATAVMVNKKTGKSEAKTVYNSTYEMKTAAIKFARVREALRVKGIMRSEIEVARNDSSTRDVADLSMLIMAQGTRPGSEGDTKGFAKLYGKQMTAKSVTIERGETSAKGKKKPDKVTLNIDGTEIPIRDKKAVAEIIRRVESGEDLHDSTYWLKSYGASTLESRHVVVDGDEVRLEFMGKESVWHRHVVSDPDVSQMLKDRKQAAQSDDSQLFGVNETKLNKFIADLDGGHFTAKDFRTMKATEIGINEINQRPIPTNADEYKAAAMAVAEVVSRKLGNEPAQALESYIDPNIFHSWRQAAGV